MQFVSGQCRAFATQNLAIHCRSAPSRVDAMRRISIALLLDAMQSKSFPLPCHAPPCLSFALMSRSPLHIAFPSPCDAKPLSSVAMLYKAFPWRNHAARSVALPLRLKSVLSPSVAVQNVAIPLQVSAGPSSSFAPHSGSKPLLRSAPRRFAMLSRRRAIRSYSSPHLSLALIRFPPSGTGPFRCCATGRYRSICRNPAIPARRFRGFRTGIQR